MKFIGRESSLPLFITEKEFFVITLIGHPESKRTFYFCQAASRLQEHINVVSHDQALTLPLNKGMVKIDPPYIRKQILA